MGRVQQQAHARQLDLFDEARLAAWRHAEARSKLRGLDPWRRRTLRCVRLKQCTRKQCTRTRTLADVLQERGVPERRAWLLALSRNGGWRLAGSPQAAEAMPFTGFEDIGLVSREQHDIAVNATGNRRGT